jgi:hypothetical protein
VGRLMCQVATPLPELLLRMGAGERKKGGRDKGTFGPREGEREERIGLATLCVLDEGRSFCLVQRHSYYCAKLWARQRASPEHVGYRWAGSEDFFW